MSLVKYVKHEKTEDCPEEFCGQPFCVGYLDADDFGKTIFLTREKAEKALEGTKGVNESDK